ncbi:hypothetical protein PTNB85_05915 [Pyrenophora teres f. teres]|nr:hypothetical protein HRS9139_08596 [Pyrenophora teres f. teres]KAE8834582.1 hypothetical protein PTNB85_05915 [Pyrenophora teres f. teres]KAE8860869.1 hypothetical protein PTNB29_05964 [Pyrenophora teres f. teres]
MEPREVFTPLSDITGQTGTPRARKPKEQPAQQPRTAVHDPDKAKRLGTVHFKATHGIIVAFFTFLLILHVLGIYLFTSGFLLTRLVLDHNSQCATPPIDSADLYTAGNAEKGCWHPKTFSKAVVIIVDALRYDFTVPFEAQFDSTDLAAAAANPSQAPPVAPRHFHNAFPVLYETAKTQPENAFLLPFIADPPTATMQRLKGLTTGTLPTFIDVGSNFAGQAIDEDNLVGQLKNASKRVVHLGDDTWHALFPDYFEPNLTHAYDSFNVWDLHTVDNGVTEHIFPLLKAENASKWDVIFGHYLGVDHAGHRYGPDHPAMTAKLNQMDDVFRRMIEEVDDDTLLVVMGDHGMDAKGDHGGESDDEIQAALWMYSKKGVFGRSDPAYVTPPRNAHIRPVGQIDLVPTLSLLLGMPIPFNNLGKPIEEAFIGKSGDDFNNLATVNRLTAAQIHKYQHEYAKVRGIADSFRASSLTLWAGANDAWNSLGKSKANSKEMRQVYEAFGVYQRDTLRICRDLWARFDIPRMVSGVTILASSLLLLAMYARIINGDRGDITPIFFTRGAIGLVLGGIFGVGLTVFMPEDARSHVLIVSAALSGIVGCASTFWSLKFRLMSPVPNSVWGWTSLTFTLALSGGFAANSFTIWEDEILLHFLTTFSVLALISSLRQRRVADRTLGAYHSILFTVLLRVASFSRLCREEQMPYCKSTYYASALSTTSAGWQLAIPAAAAILIPTFIKSYYEGTKSYQHNATLWIGLALRFGLMLSAAYWTLDAADDGNWLPGWENILQITKRLIAQIVLLISLAFGYSIYNWSKPLLNVIINKDGTDEHGAPKEAVTVLGFANVHGSRYALLITIWYLAIAVLQKPMGAGAIAILVWQIFSLFEIIDTNNLRQSPIGPVVLGLLGSFHFFKTGHQATLSSIQWESAFIPLAKIRYPWTPIIVILNTFGAQILCAIAVPCLVLWKVKPQKKGLLSVVTRAVATHILFYATINLATTMWAGHLRRHLMLLAPLIRLALSVRMFSATFLSYTAQSEAMTSCIAAASPQVKVKAAICSPPRSFATVRRRVYKPHGLHAFFFFFCTHNFDPDCLSAFRGNALTASTDIAVEGISPVKGYQLRWYLKESRHILSNPDESIEPHQYIMASRHQYTERFDSAVIVQDSTDDATDVIPMFGLNKSVTLEERFICRLGELTRADIVLDKDVNNIYVEVHIYPRRTSLPGPLEDELQVLLSGMKETMGLIASHSAGEGKALDRARETLWDTILTFSYPLIDSTISSLNNIFEEECFQGFLGNFIMPQPGSKADEELGTHLLSLYQAIKACESCMKNITALVQVASTMTRDMMNLQDRLKFCLRKAKVSNELYQLICQLGFPERVNNTLIRMARSCSSFSNATFYLERHHLSDGKPLTQRAGFPASRGASSAPKPASPPQIPDCQQPRSPETSASSFTRSMAVIEPYLAQDDRPKMLLRLAPVAKQDVAQLVGSVLRGNLPPVNSEAWYLFGFVAADDEEQERLLGGLYSEILKKAHDKQAVFVEVQRALETNNFVQLFKVKGYEHIFEIVPHLQSYLRTALEARSTAFRLKQFILNRNGTEPPAALKRDYGFRFCKQREEVLLLKEIYSNICKKMSLEDLHTACIHGRLYESAVQKGIFVDPKYKRLMQNDYPSPFVGYDNRKGLDNYRGSIFKKRLNS